MLCDTNVKGGHLIILFFMRRQIQSRNKRSVMDITMDKLRQIKGQVGLLAIVSAHRELSFFRSFT